MDISLQKSSMFSAVKSCSRKTLIATSVPFHMPRKTSPKKPNIANKKINLNPMENVPNCSHSGELWEAQQGAK